MNQCPLDFRDSLQKVKVTFSEYGSFLMTLSSVSCTADHCLNKTKNVKDQKF